MSEEKERQYIEIAGKVFVTSWTFDQPPRHQGPNILSKTDLQDDSFLTPTVLAERWKQTVEGNLATLSLRQGVPLFFFFDGELLDKIAALFSLRSEKLQRPLDWLKAFVASPGVEDGLYCRLTKPHEHVAQLGLHDALRFRFSDITFIEKMNPELGRASRRYWLTEMELRDRWKLKEAVIKDLVRHEHIRAYFFYEGRGVSSLAFDIVDMLGVRSNFFRKSEIHALEKQELAKGKHDPKLLKLQSRQWDRISSQDIVQDWLLDDPQLTIPEAAKRLGDEKCGKSYQDDARKRWLRDLGLKKRLRGRPKKSAP